MKRKRTSSSSSSQKILPDDCWESIFRFIINDEEDCNIYRFLNPLSLVSKQFLSVTDRLRSSLTVVYEPIDIRSIFERSPDYEPSGFRNIFKRFTNLNSLKLANYCIDGNNLLCKISCFPLKNITSLDLSYQRTIPAIGLRVFSQKITTVTSLNCSKIGSLNSSDLFLIAECFPLLEELDLGQPGNYTGNADDGLEALSLALCKLRKINLSGLPINNQSLFHLFNNCKLLKEVIVSMCDRITNAGIATALCERPSLGSLTLIANDVYKESGEVLATSNFIESLVRFKGLTCLVLKCLNISDELLYSIARECLPLTKLELEGCTGYSYAGIFCLLSKCQRVQHLDLQYNHFLNDQHVVQLSPFLGDLVSINLSVCLKVTESALFALIKNCPSLSEIKMETIGIDIAENSDSLREFDVYPQLKSLYLGDNSWLTNESIIIFASIFPNLQLLDLYQCRCISEGICQVLRRCCKIRHLNLTRCSKLKPFEMNFVVPKLEVLDLSNTNVDDETLYVISKSCCGLLQLSLENCNGVTEKGLKHMVENCTQLRGITVLRSIHISDKNKELFKRHGCNVF